MLSDKPLFTIMVELKPYNSRYIDYTDMVLQLTDDGTAMLDGHVVGRVEKHAWAYITTMGTAKELRQEGYNMFNVDVYGEPDRSLVVRDPHDDPYIYRCDKTKNYPAMLPSTEYRCELIRNDDRFDIIVGGNKIGTLKDNGKGRVDRLDAMIKAGYQTTAQTEIYLTYAQIFVIVRKV